MIALMMADAASISVLPLESAVDALIVVIQSSVRTELAGFQLFCQYFERGSAAAILILGHNRLATTEPESNQYVCGPCPY